MEQKLVSVIIPVYNSEKYIRTCLDSIVNQTYHNLQIIIIDDGATDKTPQICDEYASKDKRIELVHRKNGGVSSAKNMALGMVKGDYIKLIDHDDYLEKNAIEVCVDIAEKTGADIVQHCMKIVENNWVPGKDEEETVNYRQWELTAEEAILQIEPGTYRKELGEDSTLCTVVLWSKLFRRNIFDNIQFDENIKIYEDQSVVHRLLAGISNRMIYIDAPFYHFRDTQGSLSRKRNTRQNLEIVDCYEDRLKCVLELEKNKTDSMNLCYKTYRRYLICMIRNYENLSTVYEQDGHNAEYQKQLYHRFRKDRKKYKMREDMKDRVIFICFSVCPGIFKKWHIL